MMSTWTGSLTVVLLVLSIDKGVADRGVEGLGGLESELQVLLDQLASTFNTSYTLCESGFSFRRRPKGWCWHAQVEPHGCISILWPLRIPLRLMGPVVGRLPRDVSVPVPLSPPPLTPPRSPLVDQRW